MRASPRVSTMGLPAIKTCGTSIFTCSRVSAVMVFMEGIRRFTEPKNVSKWLAVSGRLSGSVRAQQHVYGLLPQVWSCARGSGPRPGMRVLGSRRARPEMEATPSVVIGNNFGGVK